MEWQVAIMIYPVHHIPGRLRIKNQRIKGNAYAAVALRRRIQAIAGVDAVTVSALTGSALIEYSPERITGLGILHQLDGIRYGADREASLAPQIRQDAPGCRSAPERLTDRLIEAVAQAMVERTATALVKGLI